MQTPSSPVARSIVVLVGALMVASSLPMAPGASGLPGTAPASCAPFSSPDRVVETWDGTPLAVDVHVPDGDWPFPVVLLGHGYANQRPRAGTGGWLDRLVDAGFMVVTWDARGHGQSGGQGHFDDPAYEGRDVLALVEFVNTTAPFEDDVKRDARGNPVVGMSGVSYGGGVQFSALIADRLLGEAPWDPTPPRVIDALAPELAWNHLEQAAIPNGVPKVFIDLLLTGAGEASMRAGGAPPPEDGLCPNVHAQHTDQHLAVGDGVAANGPTPRTAAWTGQRSIAPHLDALEDEIPPTFLVQGLRDTTLPPNEAIRTFEAIRETTPAKLMLHATGHGWSGTPDERAEDLVAWFDHTLKDEPLPPRLAGNDVVYARDGELGDAMGSDHVYTTYDALTATPPTQRSLPAHPAPLATLPAPTSYADVTFFQGDVDGQSEPGPSRTFDAPGTAVSWELPIEGDELALAGTPQLTLDLSTTTDELFLFGTLEDVRPDGRSEVIYHQAMAKAVRGAADDGPVSATWNLTALTTVVPDDHTLRLTVATSDAMHSASRQPGLTDIHGGELVLPVEAGHVGTAEPLLLAR